MTQRFVLDAWALLAFLQKEEPAAGRIRQLLEEAALEQTQLFISIINLGEVFYRIGKIKGETNALETLDQIRRLRITVLSATDEAVWAAAMREKEINRPNKALKRIGHKAGLPLRSSLGTLPK